MSKNEKQSLAMKKIWANRKLKQISAKPKRAYKRRVQLQGKMKPTVNLTEGQELFRAWLKGFSALSELIVNHGSFE